MSLLILHLLLASRLLLGSNCRVEDPDYSKADRFYVAVAKDPVFFTRTRCTAGDNAHVDVFATPSTSRKTAEIRWGSVGDVGAWSCEPLVFEPGGACPRGRLPTMEDGYEETAFVVVERADQFMRIRLDHGAGWIQLTRNYETVDYFTVVANGISEMSMAWDGRISTRPGGHSRAINRVKNQSVIVIDSSTVNGRLWFKVRLLKDSLCNGGDPQVIATGWVHAYSDKRQPTVFHYSRGC